MSEILKAAQILRQGGLVAFATETVYGLGADATNALAVARIFKAKGRPQTNPLIVHIADEKIARQYVTQWPDTAQKLAAAFWPGPLTLVLPKSPEIVDAVTAGLTTVGLRVPNHPLALELLKTFAGPIAAPSANRSNHVSPTTAQHVHDDLGSDVDFILDGGPCTVGIESTVINLCGDKPTILRPGGISRDQIQAIIGPVDNSHASIKENQPALSPGQSKVHYAPKAAAYRFEHKDFQRLIDWCGRFGEGQSCAIVMLSDSMSELDAPKLQITSLPEDPVSYARLLYSVLRDLDGPTVDVILIEMPPDTAVWAAVRDRLLRATRPLP